MRKFNTTFLTLITALLLSACSSVDINTYQDNEPKLILNEFFNGDLTAHGIIKNRSGEVIRYFNVAMTGTWNDDGVGTLAEKFIFDDDSIEFRTWTFTPVTQANSEASYLESRDFELRNLESSHLERKIQYTAKADDTLAPSLIELEGNAFFMNYDLLINYQGDQIDVNIDDKMYLVNNNIIINESVMSKYGFEVGYITLTIIKNTQ